MLDSVRIRLTLWYVGVLALVLIAFSVGVYTLLARNLHDRMDGELRSAIKATAVMVAAERAEGESDQDAARTALAELYLPRQAVALFTGSGNLVAEKTAPSNLHALFPKPDVVPSDEISFYTLPEVRGRKDDGERVAVKRLAIPASGSNYLIVAAQSFETIDQELELLRGVFLVVVPFALAMTGLGGWFLARKSLRPVLIMSERARQLSAQNLDKQLPVANPRDELGHLAQTFNDLLGRLDRSFSQQLQFMADASHELRTPLSVLQTAASVTLGRNHRDETEYREALSIVEQQTRRLTRIVEDMFTLARVDAGDRTLHPTHFYLDELMAETVRAAAVLARQKDVEIRMNASSEAPCRGDEGLLRQMLLNLLDNAVKYTPTGGRVYSSLEKRNSKYTIIISDTGRGIPAEAQEHIFDRFFRVDDSRSHNDTFPGSGAGLGLSIARWIAEAHQGGLELLHSGPTGSTFQITLPNG